MSTTSSVHWSKSSTASGKSVRSGKSLAEKIRELGISIRERTPTIVNVQPIEIKTESHHSSDYSIMTPTLNLEQIIYFQPELTYDESAPEKILYKFGEFDVKQRKEIRRISDIEVKSYRPNTKMVFRKKKRHSSIISRIEDILNKGKGPMPVKDPSEESIFVVKTPEPEKRIYDLSESILQQIFSHFTMKERNLILSRVCKSWYYILKDPMFWTELEFRGSKVPEETVVKLIQRYPTLLKLRLTSVPYAADVLQELCRCNHNIRHLGVRHCNVGNQDFARTILHVISCCTNLETLDIKGMQFQSQRFFLEIGRLKNLRSLNLTGNKMLKNQNLITLSVNCRSLKELRILDISLNNEQGAPLKDEDLIFIAFNLQPNLEVLKIDMQQLRNVSYQAIINCSNLTNLAMKNCLHLTGDVFTQLSKLTNLKKLKITRGINLKPEDFQFVFANENMSQITDLDINGCWGVGGGGLEAITSRLTSLRSLSLKNCKSIKSQHLVHLSRCPDLTHLNIAHTNVESNNLLLLHQHVKKLKSLVIDAKIYQKPLIQKLKKFFPDLTITLSFSEYQKNEELLKE